MFLIDLFAHGMYGPQWTQWAAEAEITNTKWKETNQKAIITAHW